jgi:DMSO reductase family type II enzyme heme b subunit
LRTEVGAVRIRRVTATADKLLDVDGPAWAGLESRMIELIPAPVSLAVAVSPYMVLSQDHGKVKRLRARIAHDGETLSVRLSWADPHKDDRIADLDRFVDGAAVLFPLLGDANPLTMGDENLPVNAWLWRADRAEPFDVIARGFSTSRRRPSDSSGLVASGVHRDGEWVVVFQRPLQPADGEFVGFAPGGPAKIAFAVWEGSNAERAGQKAVSGAFLDLTLDP